MDTNRRENERAHLRRLHRLVVHGSGSAGHEVGAHAAFDLWVRVTRVVLAYERCRNQSRRLHPLTAQERRALGILWESGPLPLSALARAVPLSVPAASAMVNRLVTRGYIDRSEDPADRRRVVLRATSMLVDSMDASSFEGTVRVTDALAAHSAEELATTSRVLETIYAAEDQFASEFEALRDEELRELLAGWEEKLAALDDAMLVADGPDGGEGQLRG